MMHSCDGQNAVASSDETNAMKKELSAIILTPQPSLPSLPSDLVEEILARLPIKFLIQLRCVCKSWNSLISDNPKFARKHLRMSRRCHLFHTLSVSESTVNSYPIHSTFTTTMASNFTQLECPPNDIYATDPPMWLHILHSFVGSCDGIFCLVCNSDSACVVVLWNPSIRKFKELPATPRHYNNTAFGFGYDSLSDTYKVVVVNSDGVFDGSSSKTIIHTKVFVHTLGTNFWRIIKEEFPSAPHDMAPKGVFVFGNLNWLTDTYDFQRPSVIFSLNLENESYQEVLQPDYGGVVNVDQMLMSVLNDCLCILHSFDVWVMKEYGNKDSWTKMFRLPDYRELPDKRYHLVGSIYIFEDGQLLLHFFTNLALYDPRSGTLNFDSMPMALCPQVLIESLISPCSSCWDV